MPIHIGECVLGVFAFDDEGKLLSSRQFPRNPADIAGRLATVQMGNPTQEHRELVKEFIRDGIKEFTLESKPLVERLSKEFPNAKFEALMPNKAGSILRGKLQDIAEEVGFKGADALLREVNFILTRYKLKKEAAQRDRLIIQSIDILDQIDKFINILTGQVREWYSTHFPELDRLVPDHEAYLKLVLTLGNRDRFTQSSVQSAAGLPEEAAMKISEEAKKSLGAPFDEVDITAVQESIQEIMGLQVLRGKVSEYIEGLMAQIAPNLRAVIGGAIGARLISKAGGLERLSRMPASTIQVLGAEKALFRAMRTKARPPKHGLIYQHPEIKGAPRKLRGKIARSISGKLAIASRVDAMSGEFVGDKLAADIKSRIVNVRASGEIK
ncbi:MAG: C/D box methylation guide ribonucleoprotein complex aNOP56 subunit [Candidatus Hadarchaeota archaeon]